MAELTDDLSLVKMNGVSCPTKVNEEASLHEIKEDSQCSNTDEESSSLIQLMSAVSICKTSETNVKSIIDWEEYFMSIAYLVSNRSKDPSTQVGACIVNQRKRIVGQGYNGMPRGCNDDEFPWQKVGPDLETKYFYVCHAEMNAIFNKNCDDISNCTIYTILFPCNQCTKTIIQSGITEVVYMCDKNKNKVEAIASMKMMDACKVRYRQLRLNWAGLNIDFKKGLCEIVSCQSNNFPQPAQCIDTTKKRQNCLPWDAYFLAISILVAKRSKCPDEQLGACIVNEDKCIVGQGYNGMPQKCGNAFPWGTDSKNILENRILYECHAELNAILNANLQVKGCKLYTITFPCNECAKAIIQSGIKEVIHLKKPEDKDTYVAAKIMFNAAKVTYRQHTPKDENLYVDFSQIEL